MITLSRNIFLIKVLMLVVIWQLCISCKKQNDINPVETTDFSYTLQDNGVFKVIKLKNNVIKKITWDFGDGEISDEQKPLHQYFFNGEYDVKMNLFDGKNQTISSIKIKIENSNYKTSVNEYYSIFKPFSETYNTLPTEEDKKRGIIEYDINGIYDVKGIMVPSEALPNYNKQSKSLFCGYWIIYNIQKDKIIFFNFFSESKNFNLNYESFRNLKPEFGTTTFRVYDKTYDIKSQAYLSEKKGTWKNQSLIKNRFSADYSGTFTDENNKIFEVEFKVKDLYIAFLN